MPSFTFTDSENVPYELLNGDFPFEVVSVDFAISKGAKTKGADVAELKVMVYSDVTFTKKRAQVTEHLIFHDSCKWKVDTFVKSANLLINGKAPEKNQSIEFTEEALCGLRGWATFKPETDQNDKEKKWNKVAVWLTDKPKLDRVKPDDF